MEIKTVDIAGIYGLNAPTPIKCFLHKADGEIGPFNKNLPAMVVVPGGGYHFVSERETDPIAVDFFNRHYNAFALKYGVAPDYRYPTSINQLAATVDYLKRNAKKLGIDKNRIFVVGFSAGGHLTATLANFCDNLPVPVMKSKKLDARPAGVVLGYPVITPESHQGSFRNLLGIEDVHCPEAEALSLEKTVSPLNPPCFIWTTAEDNSVDPMATVLYTSALLKNKVKCECHIFPDGWHGAATCDERTNHADGVKVFERSKCWLDLAADFLQSLPSLKNKKKN